MQNRRNVRRSTDDRDPPLMAMVGFVAVVIVPLMTLAGGPSGFFASCLIVVGLLAGVSALHK